MPISREEILKTVSEVRKKATDRNFVQSFDLAVGLKDINLNNPENRINTKVELPHGIGRSQKVAVLADGELAERARAAEADRVVGRDEIKKLGDNKPEAKKFAEEFDSFIAKADMMPFIGKQLGPVLGPRGKMPQPIPPNANPSDLIKRSRSMVRVRVRTEPAVHLIVGKEEMSDEQIADNVKAVLDTIESNLPKGNKQINSVYLKTTMGKPVRLM
ncbi:50S ribosomal protein L1 [candidate division MSBL1 archaeon SCGC-AAA261F19]|uniref:Large ribosomal subunit protein uL1 n=2 Tax=candidate division MSBL1 TaxID=215777 RepID=A0A133VAI6_9EURY|nr:50S ribosomal protein L1 [candidate division MSBL1 archaeon SCGC-AAA261D19]KXB03453.1 50S ribosomal protein L1 [candidate division MSBL1 archaeon SCGC-AAA261F19]